MYSFGSSRVASRGIVLSDSQFDDDFFGSEAFGSTLVSSAVTVDGPSTSSLEQSVSTFTRLKQRVNRLWIRAVQRWPVVLVCAVMYLSFYVNWIRNQFIFVY